MKTTILLLPFFLIGCTTIKYVPVDIPKADTEILESCETLEAITFQPGQTEIDVAQKLLSERKQHIDCRNLNEKKKLWIETLEKTNIHK